MSNINSIFSLNDKVAIEFLLKPYVEGIEITQGIQYYKAERHLTDTADRNVDNSIALVANKPAWVRVYIRDRIISGRTVTGELQVERNWLYPPIWLPSATLYPQPPGTIITQGTVITQLDPDYATERSNILSTLNFIIPADLMSMNLRLTAKIWLEGGNTNSPLNTFQMSINVMLLQTLFLRGVMINYNGPDPTVGVNPPPNINLPAPTVSDLQSTAAWTLTTNPVQTQGVFSSAGTMSWSTPLTGLATGPGGCSLEWLALNAAVAQVRTNDGNRTDVIYYGLLPAGTPIQNVGGCESSGVSTGPNGSQITMAHEIGHAANLSHGPCGTPGDPNYPAYEPYDPLNTPTASLGEYGLDINNGTIHTPTEKDYMSYCFPNWISLYHYTRLYYNIRFNRQILELSKPNIPELVDPYLWPWEYIPDPPQPEINPGNLKMKAQKIISIIGIYNEKHQVEIKSIMRVNAIPSIPDALRTDLVANLVDERSNNVASIPVMSLKSYGHDCRCHDKRNPDDFSPPFVFQAIIPDIDSGTELNITKKGNDGNEDIKIWKRSAPVSQPHISKFEVKIIEGKGIAEWNAEMSSDYEKDFSLQFSKDKGRSWNSLATGIHEHRYQFQLGDLPVETLLFRLLANDGFYTTTMESAPVEIPSHPPIISIFHPHETSSIIAGRTMRLWAAVNTHTIPNTKIKNYIWLIDDKEVASGIDVWITAPGKGNHKCTFIVQYDDTQAEVTVYFDSTELNNTKEVE